MAEVKVINLGGHGARPPAEEACAAGFAASLATAMRARGHRTAGGGDYRWALLRTKEA